MHALRAPVRRQIFACRRLHASLPFYTKQTNTTCGCRIQISCRNCKILLAHSRDRGHATRKLPRACWTFRRAHLPQCAACTLFFKLKLLSSVLGGVLSRCGLKLQIRLHLAFRSCLWQLMKLQTSSLQLIMQLSPSFVQDISGEMWMKISLFTSLHIACVKNISSYRDH